MSILASRARRASISAQCARSFAVATETRAPTNSRLPSAMRATLPMGLAGREIVECLVDQRESPPRRQHADLIARAGPAQLLVDVTMHECLPGVLFDSCHLVKPHEPDPHRADRLVGRAA